MLLRLEQLGIFSNKIDQVHTVTYSSIFDNLINLLTVLNTYLEQDKTKDHLVNARLTIYYLNLHLQIYKDTLGLKDEMKLLY